MGKSGGQTSTTTQSYDPAYNAGMLSISQEQQDWAREMYDQYKTGGGLDYDKAVLKSNAELLPLQKKAEETSLNDSITAINERAPLRSKFLGSAMEGVDTGAAMNRAEANVQQAYKGAEAQIRRNAMRTGANPDSGAYAALQTRSALDQAKAVAGARTNAYKDADKESYGRLRDAMSIGI